MDVIHSMNMNYMNSGVKKLCTVTKLETSNIFHQLKKAIIMKQFCNSCIFACEEIFHATQSSYFEVNALVQSALKWKMRECISMYSILRNCMVLEQNKNVSRQPHILNTNTPVHMNTAQYYRY